jgi:hypothetical protein
MLNTSRFLIGGVVEVERFGKKEKREVVAWKWFPTKQVVVYKNESGNDTYDVYFGDDAIARGINSEAFEIGQGVPTKAGVVSKSPVKEVKDKKDEPTSNTGKT